MIRLTGGVELSKSLMTNRTLTYLDLSYNSLGNAGGIALGCALQENRTLKTLLIVSNSIDAMACVTIVAGALENVSLEYINFDGNPIGEDGAKAIMVSTTTFSVSFTSVYCVAAADDDRQSGEGVSAWMQSEHQGWPQQLRFLAYAQTLRTTTR